MGVILAALGAVLVVVALADAVVTTLAAGQGGGPVTRRAGNLARRGLRAVSSGPSSRVLPYAGALVLLLTVLIWVLLLWAGWVLVFGSADRAVLSATTLAPADWPARVYFAGFVVFTLGVGDVVPGSGSWQVLTAAASFLGLFLVTLSITYLVSVVSAAVQSRTLARAISLSGDTGTGIVLLHWDGEQVSSSWDALAQTLTSQVLQFTQQHLAYPVLHHFHAASGASSAPRSLAALDDAVLLLRAGLAPGVRPGRDGLLRLERAIEHYATTVGETDAGRSGPPPLPDLGPLRRAGVPTVSDEEFAVAAEGAAVRRTHVDQLVTADARRWPVHA